MYIIIMVSIYLNKVFKKFRSKGQYGPFMTLLKPYLQYNLLSEECYENSLFLIGIEN